MYPNAAERTALMEDSNATVRADITLAAICRLKSPVGLYDSQTEWAGRSCDRSEVKSQDRQGVHVHAESLIWNLKKGPLYIIHYCPL